ncbi:MAG: TIGR01620 family protein [Pseudomonadota bacterium]
MSDQKPSSGPVVFDLAETEETVSPASAPPVDETVGSDRSTVAAAATVVAASGGNRMAAVFLWLVGILGSTMVVYGLFTTAEALFIRNSYLGVAFATLVAVFLVVVLALIVREFAALSRLRRVDQIRTTAEEVLARSDLNAARKLGLNLQGFYGNHRELKWSRRDLKAQLDETFDADAALALAERALLEPLDAAALAEVEAASRRVATVTALVPLALVDIVTALFANLRMIRRVSEIYGGRAGSLGAWRLTRGVMRHLLATGALAITDDLLGSIAGGTVLSKVSRRFGEGLVNGALTARIGLAAMEVCRPLPYMDLPKPTLAVTAKRALTGLFTAQGTGT